MDVLSWVFGGAFVIALVTGEAYFRGSVRKADDPQQYWIVLACYVALATFIPVIRLFKG